MRKAGILLPIFSLPSQHGIGCFSKEAYDFVDFLSDAKQSYWQILPMGPTGYGDSPYQSFSTFAGNPYFIDIEELIKAGLLTEESVISNCLEGFEGIDYEYLYNHRFTLLKEAYEKSDIANDKAFREYAKENEFWLKDYALYTVIKRENNGNEWTKWPTELKSRDKKALAVYEESHKSELMCVYFEQFYFYKQWKALKEYANKKGIEIIGDIPIYVAADSADVWANPELFDLDESFLPKKVAGCPPDAFSKTGQLWGNPLYKWDYHKKTGYEWWIKRVEHCFKLYDVVRIDHFRGFDEYYAIPYGDPTAEFGSWQEGPGISLFEAIKEKLGEKKIIAEDLGVLTDSVRELVKETGFPGMKVLQFAFGGDSSCEYLPHMLTDNSVIYTGTHDNDTTKGWYTDISKNDKDSAFFINEYTGKKLSKRTICAEFIRMAYASVCDTAIIPMQDFLELDGRARINMPSTLGGNWCFRLQKGCLKDKLSLKISKLVNLYYR